MRQPDKHGPKALPSVPEVVVQLKVLRADARDLRRDSDDREPFRLDVELKERASIRRELAAGEMPVGDGRWVVVGGHAGSPSVYSNDKNADLESVARKLVAAHAGR